MSLVLKRVNEISESIFLISQRLSEILERTSQILKPPDEISNFYLLVSDIVYWISAAL